MFVKKMSVNIAIECFNILNVVIKGRTLGRAFTDVCKLHEFGCIVTNALLHKDFRNKNSFSESCMNDSVCV